MADISRQPDSAAQQLDPVLVEGALFFRPEEGGNAEIAQGAKAAAEHLQQQQQEQHGARNYPSDARNVAHGEGAWSFRFNHSNAGRASEAAEGGSTGADLGVQLRSINVRTTRNRNTPRTSWERQEGSTLDSSSSPDSASPFGTASVTATEAGDSLAVYQRAVAKLVTFGFNGKEMNDHARRLIALGAGGVILFSRNFSDPRQLASLCADLKRAAFPRRLLIMVDQEGGRVTRLGPPFTCIPAARTIGLDSHLALPYSSHDLSRLESVELVPFARAAVDADVAAVMVAHSTVGAVFLLQEAKAVG
ncbi:unnamed protein product [Closterium sp. Naga37s-1]|nr:unnamed protein product [Closterium sp. Naga37s-1]